MEWHPQADLHRELAILGPPDYLLIYRSYIHSITLLQNIRMTKTTWGYYDVIDTRSVIATDINSITTKDWEAICTDPRPFILEHVLL